MKELKTQIIEKYSTFMDWNNIVKMSISPKAIYTFSVILSRIQGHFSENYRKLAWNHIRLWIPKLKASYSLISNYITHLIIMVIKTIWYWHQNRYLNQWYRKDSPEINALICIYFMTKDPSIYTGKRTASSINGNPQKERI